MMRLPGGRGGSPSIGLWIPSMRSVTARASRGYGHPSFIGQKGARASRPLRQQQPAGGTPALPYGRQAFSLVEVALALGVAVFAAIGLLGLLQSGLSNYREAMNSSISSAIGQQVVSDSMLAEFDKLAASPPATNFYDERGIPLPNNQASNAIYVSSAEILPGTISGIARTNVIGLQVTVTSPTQPLFKKTFVSYIARQGKDTP